MKLVTLLSATALALAPVLATAQSTTPDPTDPVAGAPLPGGTAVGGILPVFAAGAIPAGTAVIGGLVVVVATGLVIGIVADDDGGTTTTTTTTTN